MRIKEHISKFQKYILYGNETTGDIPFPLYMKDRQFVYSFFYILNFYTQRYLPLNVRLLLCFCFFFLVYSIQDPENILMVQGIYFFVTAFLVSAVVGFVFRPRISFTRRLPAKCMANTAIQVDYKVRNDSSRGVWDLRLDSFPFLNAEFVKGYAGSEYLSVNELQVLHTVVVFPFRGLVKLPRTYACSSFPFGMFAWGRLGGGDNTVLVLPQISDLDEVDLSFGGFEGEGEEDRHSNSNDTGDQEFMKIREYREGDPVRLIHWAATARIGRPVVKDFNESNHRKISIYLDEVYNPSILKERHMKTYPIFESSISLAASLVDWARRNKVGISYLFINNVTYQLDGMTIEEEAEYATELLAKVRNNVDKSTRAFPEMENFCTAEDESACFAIFNYMDDERKEFVKKHHLSTKIMTVNPRLPQLEGLTALDYKEVLENKLRTI